MNSRAWKRFHKLPLVSRCPLHFEDFGWNSCTKGTFESGGIMNLRSWERTPGNTASSCICHSKYMAPSHFFTKQGGEAAELAPACFQPVLMRLCGWSALVWISKSPSMNQSVIVSAASGTKQSWAINSRQMGEMSKQKVYWSMATAGLSGCSVSVLFQLYCFALIIWNYHCSQLEFRKTKNTWFLN